MQSRLSSLFANKTIVYLDLEYLHEVLHERKRPSDHHWREVVQFGAVKFDHSQGKEIDKFSCNVRPTLYHSQLAEESWKYFRGVTGLSKDEIMAGTDFKDAFNQFQHFCGDHQVVIMLGDKDVLEFNLKALGIDHPQLNYIRLKPILCELDSGFNNVCSGELYKEVQLKVEEIIPDNEAKHAHNGLFDARSMAWFVNKKINE